MIPFVELGEFSSAVAYTVGGLVVLAVLGYWRLSRSVGRVDGEWGHERTVTKDLRRLRKTVQILVGDGDDPTDDIAHCLEVTRDDVDRRDRVVAWLRRRVSSQVVVHACPITDAEDRPIYVASVDGLRLAHRDAEALLEDCQTVIDARRDDADVPATLSEYYYSDVVEGRVDLDRTRSRVRGDCKTRIQDNMEREGDLPREELVETLVYDSGFRYPRYVVEEKLSELIGRDIREYKDGRLQWQRF